MEIGRKLVPLSEAITKMKGFSMWGMVNSLAPRRDTSSLTKRHVVKRNETMGMKL
jgi:hypothetical protein